MNASKMLLKAEKKSSQVKKEGLAIAFAVKYFHHFIYRRHLTI